MAKFYKDQSIFVYNGNRYAGVQTLAEVFKSLPPSNHTIDLIDAQPIPAGVYSSFSAYSILLFVGFLTFLQLAIQVQY